MDQLASLVHPLQTGLSRGGLTEGCELINICQKELKKDNCNLYLVSIWPQKTHRVCTLHRGTIVRHQDNEPSNLARVALWECIIIRKIILPDQQFSSLMPLELTSLPSRHNLQDALRNINTCVYREVLAGKANQQKQEESKVLSYGNYQITLQHSFMDPLIY